MSLLPVAIYTTGLVTSVGLSAPAACAAIRARLSNPIETRFIDSGGEWIVGHEVPLGRPWRGRTKLVKMAGLAVNECLRDISQEDRARIPLLLCVAEHDRLGRIEGLDDALFAEIQQDLAVEFASGSAVIAQGRISIGVALRRAREMLATQPVPAVLIAAVDSLLTWATISGYERSERLLTSTNSNGFMPGEGAGALLVGRPTGHPQLTCTGIGLATEPNHIGADEPLRADGLANAIKSALADAGCAMHDIDFRVVDVSGEQYYFKEAALAVSRLLRQPKDEFDIWHPAECIGESGAVAGFAALAVVDAACRKDYAAGHNVLFHAANDGGQRAAAVLRFG